jgi:hypothetical protein
VLHIECSGWDCDILWEVEGGVENVGSENGEVGNSDSGSDEVANCGNLFVKFDKGRTL